MQSGNAKIDNLKVLRQFAEALFPFFLYFRWLIPGVWILIENQTDRILINKKKLTDKKLIVPPKNIPCFDAHKEWPKSL